MHGKVLFFAVHCSLYFDSHGQFLRIWYIFCRGLLRVISEVNLLEIPKTPACKPNLKNKVLGLQIFQSQIPGLRVQSGVPLTR